MKRPCFNEEWIMHPKRPTLLILALLLAGLACSLPGRPVTPTGDVVATQVARALTATAEAVSHAVPVTPVIPTVAPTAPLPPILRIAYTDAGNIWLIEGDEPPVQLTTSGTASDLRISSDGQRIAFLSRSTPEAHGELRVVNSDGTGETILLTAANLDLLHPIVEGTVGTDISDFDFLPGTHTILFNTYAIPEFIGLMKYDDLISINADSGAWVTLLPAGTGGDFTLSPDGTRVAVVTPTTISILDLAANELRSDLVTYEMVTTYSEFLYYVQPVWAVDSSALGVAIPSGDPLSPTRSGTIWRIPADGSPATAMGTIAGDFYFPFFNGEPSISVDSSRVAFTRDTPTPNVSELYFSSADGTGEVAFTSGSIAWYGWAPDSVHFVYSFSSPSEMILGEIGAVPLPIGPGTDLRWISGTEFLYIAGRYGETWTLTRGDISGGRTALASPVGYNVWYDFAW